MKAKTTHIQDKLSKLFEVAENQQGLFTANQAKQVGFLPTNFTYHVQKGGWLREMRGIYRLKNFPQDQVKAEYILYSLWSRDRNDKPQGVFSHETALSIYELSDLMPAKVHMTVPKPFRKSAEIPKILKLHFNILEQSDIQKWEGIRVTKPFRTILDLIEERRTSLEFIEQAFIEGLRRGLISIKAIEAYINTKNIDDEIKKHFKQWLAHWRSQKTKGEKI